MWGTLRGLTRRKQIQISFLLNISTYLLTYFPLPEENCKFFRLLPIHCNVLWQLQLEQPISLFSFSFKYLQHRKSFHRLFQVAVEAKSGKFNFEKTLIDVLGCAKCDTNLWCFGMRTFSRGSGERWNYRIFRKSCSTALRPFSTFQNGWSKKCSTCMQIPRFMSLSV